MHVVIVADDRALVDDTASALRLAGFTVAGFTNPGEALDAIETSPDVALLVTQVAFGPVAPSGIALARMARHRRPQLKVLLAASPSYAWLAASVGEVVLWPISVPDLVGTVLRVAHAQTAGNTLPVAWPFVPPL